jgi:hypothetical protein
MFVDFKSTPVKRFIKKNKYKFIMNCFMKEVWNGNGVPAHNQFVRFSKGTFSGRAALNLQKSTKIKLGGSFEWTNDFIKLVAEIDASSKFSGLILSKEDIAGMSGRKKSGLNEYEVTSLPASKINEIKDRVYTMLLDAEGKGISLKMKKKLPKPGKSGELKIDDKFCVLEADLSYWKQISDAFMLPDSKKCKVHHTFCIEDIILPAGEKDFEKIRILAKRKGKIIRKMNKDKVETKEEKSFEA